MKIVHVMLCGPVTDGWSYQDNLLTKYHRKSGYDVTMITSQWVWGENGNLVKFEKTNYRNEDDVKVIRLPMKGRDDFSRKFKRYDGLKETLESESPDILFIHGVSFCDAKVVTKYICTHKIERVYVDNHSDFSNSGTNWLSKNILHKIIWKHYAQMLNPYVTKFYGVLLARVDWLVDMYGLPKEKCELLVMGADDEKAVAAFRTNARTKIREKYRIAPDDFLIMTGGKIDPAKAQTLQLMDAVAQIKNPRVKLIVFGSVTSDLQRQVNARCIENKVWYIGWIKSDDSYKYFAAADLVVFPGRHSVFWEQVAGMGIPMFCKYWEGTTHVDLGGNAEFLYQNSAYEIQTKIEELLNNPEKYESMQIVAKKGAKYFSYKDIAERCVEDGKEKG